MNQSDFPRKSSYKGTRNKRSRSVRYRSAKYRSAASRSGYGRRYFTGRNEQGRSKENIDGKISLESSGSQRRKRWKRDVDDFKYGRARN